MNAILGFSLSAALLLHVGLALVCVWRAWRGETIVDRLLALDLTATLTVAVLVLVAILEGSSFYLDVALGLAAMGAISSIALAKFIADQRMF